LLQCKQCHRQTSVISGTLLASANLPLTVWFLGIYLITQSKDGISSLNLARHLGISANAALRMKHKLQQTMKDIDATPPSHAFKPGQGFHQRRNQPLGKQTPCTSKWVHPAGRTIKKGPAATGPFCVASKSFKLSFFDTYRMAGPYMIQGNRFL